MKLTIALAVAAVVLRFETPGPGSYYVFSGVAGTGEARVEASNHNTNAVHVAVQLPAGEPARVFWVWFKAD